MENQKMLNILTIKKIKVRTKLKGHNQMIMSFMIFSLKNWFWENNSKSVKILY